MTNTTTIAQTYTQRLATLDDVVAIAHFSYQKKRLIAFFSQK
ncbi:MAG: hypothetical protein SWX82_18135 [Cyanobacteriota bacterium]|nr:hypothetical protein [Cyanobacteriota bacterium]